ALGFCEFAPPASHCSPFAVSTMLLPQVSFDLQSAEQPSPEVVLPSSHASVGSLIMSPQRPGRQFGRHAAPGLFEFAAPASHSSPNALSTMLSPHFWLWQLVRQVALGLFELSPP